MNRQTTIKNFSGLLNILTCLIGVTVVLYRQNWFGKSDTYSLIFWTIPLSIGLAISGNKFLNLFKTGNILFRLLIIIVIAGLLSLAWTYCVSLILGPWINAFSFPILYLWIVGSVFQLIFLDRKLPKQTDKIKTSKIILGLLAFPLTLILVVVSMFLFSFLSSYLTRPEKETYLIPDGYKGVVLVIFNQKDGEKPEYENNRRIYRIPKTGILFTQLKDEQGLINQEYYYVSPTGQRKKLGVLDTRDFNEEWTTVKNPKEPPRDSLAIFNPGTMGTMGNSGDKDSKVFSELSIGTYNDKKIFEDFKTEYIDSLQNVTKRKNGR